MIYSLDTSALLNGRRELFPPDVHVELWQQVESMIGGGEIRCADEVRFEVARRDDEVSAWARAQPDLFEPLSADIQRSARRVLEQHPTLLGHALERDTAEPFAIALALARHGVVVTGEPSAPRAAASRVTDVCDAMGVPCVSLATFCADRGWA